MMRLILVNGMACRSSRTPAGFSSDTWMKPLRITPSRQDRIGISQKRMSEDLKAVRDSGRRNRWKRPEARPQQTGAPDLWDTSLNSGERMRRPLVEMLRPRPGWSCGATGRSQTSRVAGFREESERSWSLRQLLWRQPFRRGM